MRGLSAIITILLLLPGYSSAYEKLSENEDFGWAFEMDFVDQNWRQKYPEFTDKVIHFYDWGVSSDCDGPDDIDRVEHYLARGDWEALEENCYYQRVSTIHYPQNTGSDNVDKLIKEFIYTDKHFKYYCANYIEYALNYLPPHYLSIVIVHFEAFPCSGRIRYETISFDLKTGRALTLEDIFPNLDYSIPLLEDYVLRNQLWLGHPEGDHRPLDLKMSRISLKEDGLYIIYNVHEQGTGMDGARAGFIPVADMPKLGGETKFWEQ